MTMYWLYDLPSWMFGSICVAFFTAYGVVGLLVSRRWVRRQHQVDHSHNDIVSYFLAAITVFYGITLGLLAVATWNTYSTTQDKVDREAQVAASLYRDVAMLPAPENEVLKSDLRAYVRDVVDVGWPQQRRGIVPTTAGSLLDRFGSDLEGIQPGSAREIAVVGEVYRQFDVLVESRRARLESVTTGMPQALWILVLLGGLITITVTLFFDTPSLSMHLWMTVLLTVLLGLMIFLIGSLDRPFRGKVSIGPGSLERVYEQVMR